MRDITVYTPTGRRINLEEMVPSDVRIRDIAYTLAFQTRFGGRVRKYYSVAEHSWHVSRRVRDVGGTVTQQLMALHHDDEEAFVTDMPRPLKYMPGMEPYRTLGTAIQEKILMSIGLPPSLDLIVKEADHWIVGFEKYMVSFFPCPEKFTWEWSPMCWEPSVATAKFMDRHAELIANL